MKNIQYLEMSNWQNNVSSPVQETQLLFYNEVKENYLKTVLSVQTHLKKIIFRVDLN